MYCKYSHTLLNTLAIIVVSSLYDYDATSLKRIFLGSFSHSSFQNFLSSIRLDGEHSHIQMTVLQVWAQSWPLKDIHRAVTKPLLSSWLCV